MNPTQMTTTLAPLIAFAAGLLAGNHVFGLDVATWTTVIGSIAGLGATIWAAIATKQKNLVNTVAAMPEVKEVKLEQSAPTDLVNATVSNVTK